MRSIRRTAFLIVGALLLIGGCSGEEETSTSPSSPSASAADAGSPREAGPSPAPGSGSGQSRSPGNVPSGARTEAAGGQAVASKPTDAERRRAASGAKATYRAYVDAINERDGATLCALLPEDAERLLRPPESAGTCAAELAASIGYRDPRGYPVWKGTTLTAIESAAVSRDLDSARLTAAIRTEFADRSQPSLESDIAYLERIGGRWRLAKPTGALYRAIGRAELPPTVIAPP